MFATLLVAPAEARPVYVVINEDNRVDVIDSATNQLTGTPFGTTPIPQRIAITPDARYLYLVHTGTDAVTVIDTATGQQVGTPIGVGDAPSGIAITPDGRFAYVANNNGSTVSVIDTQTRQVVKTITGFSVPPDVAIAPDGKTAYVANASGNSVSVVDLTSNEIVGLPIPVGLVPEALVVAPDGRFVYVANQNSNNVSVIDTAARATVGTPIPVGTLPIAITITPDGSTVYVSNYASSNVTPIDTAMKTAGPPIATGLEPYGLAPTPDGRSVYVAEEQAETVSVIDTAKNARVATVPSVGHRPEAVVVAPDQPPTAAFAFGAARPGVPVSFDAAGSADPDGAIASYSWTFGDGASASGGPAQSHVYAKPGSYPVTLTLADELGCSTQVSYGSHVAFCNGGPAAVQQRTVRVAYPRVRVTCPTRALKGGCRAKLTVVLRKPRKGKGKPRLRPETAVARIRLQPGKSSRLTIVPKPAFRVKLASARRALVRQVLDFEAASGHKHLVTLVRKPIF